MHTRYRQNLKHVAERRIRDEAVLMPITSEVGGVGKMYDLNPSATLIWDLAREGIQAEDIVAHFMEQFDGDETQIRADILAILGDLVQVGALIQE